MLKKQTVSNRGARVASVVQKFVAEILRDDYSEDPAVSRVSIVGADSAAGLQFVKLFYYVRGADGVQRRLDAITPAVRRELARRMNQKFVPEIRFAYDDTLEKSARIDQLLANIEKE